MTSLCIMKRGSNEIFSFPLVCPIGYARTHFTLPRIRHSPGIIDKNNNQILFVKLYMISPRRLTNIDPRLAFSVFCNSFIPSELHKYTLYASNLLGSSYSTKCRPVAIDNSIHTSCVKGMLMKYCRLFALSSITIHCNQQNDEHVIQVEHPSDAVNEPAIVTRLSGLQRYKGPCPCSGCTAP